MSWRLFSASCVRTNCRCVASVYRFTFLPHIFTYCLIIYIRILLWFVLNSLQNNCYYLLTVRLLVSCRLYLICCLPCIPEIFTRSKLLKNLYHNRQSKDRTTCYHQPCACYKWYNLLTNTTGPSDYRLIKIYRSVYRIGPSHKSTDTVGLSDDRLTQ